MSLGPVKLLILAVVGVAQLTVSANASGKEQTSFSAEVDHFDNQAILPTAAITELAKDKSIAHAIEDNRPSGGLPPQSWFVATVVHLSQSSEQDFLVMGNPPLAGANLAPFWILRPSNHGFDTVFSGGAHRLSVLRARSNGYRDIELLSATCCALTTTRLRFDGKKYRVASEKTTDIK